MSNYATLLLQRDNDPERLRNRAAHFRRLAVIVEDKAAAAETLKIAVSLEAKALEIETEHRVKMRLRK
jgi:hypothetical protein